MTIGSLLYISKLYNILNYFFIFKRILGHECNPTMMASSLRHHLVGAAGKGGNHDDMVAQQSKDAIIYVTVSIIESHTYYGKKTGLR